MMRLVALFAWLLVLTASASGADPKVPIGKDPGGEAVAFLTTGLDYRVPEVARVLARDGEGEIIGWDFVDEDQRPFAVEGDGAALALALGRAGRVRLIPLRVSVAHPASLARAVAFVARTPARTVVVPMESDSQAEWEGFAAAARHFKQLLFIVVSEDGKAFPAGFKLDNALVIGRIKGAAADITIEARTSAEAARQVVAYVLCSAGPPVGTGAERRTGIAELLAGADADAIADPAGAAAPGCKGEGAR